MLNLKKKQKQLIFFLILILLFFPIIEISAVENTRQSQLIFCEKLKNKIKVRAEEDARHDSQNFAGLSVEREKTELDIQILYNQQNTGFKIRGKKR